MTSTLRTLLDRVEQGEGADFELDCRLAWTFGLEPWAGRPEDHVGLCMPRSKIAQATPAFTSSIDAALSLAETILTDREPLDVIAIAVEHLTLNGFYDSKPRGPQACRAILALIINDKLADESLLRAKIAQEGEQ